MRILAWNIRHGGGRRTGRIIERLQLHRPDVVILSEYRCNAHGQRIIEALGEMGLVHHRCNEMPPRANTLCIASRVPFEGVRCFPDLNPHAHRLLEVRFAHFTLLGCYLPQKREKTGPFEKLLALSDGYCRSDSPVLLLGDLNTGKHYCDEDGATFVVAEYLDRLEQCGWLDLWRAQHGATREYTWYSIRGRGFRIDHAFGNASCATMVRSVQYVHEDRLGGASDHSSMMLELDSDLMT